MDFQVVLQALQGVYGAYVLTDGFTVQASDEVYAGIRIFELANQARIKHFIWSGGDYVSKVRYGADKTDTE